MADVALESGVAFEFIKYLKAQLKETREQLQRANEENSVLKGQLEVPRTTAASDEVKSLKKELKRLRKEIDGARESAELPEAKVATRRTQPKAQSSKSATHMGNDLHRIREELASSVEDGSPARPTLIQFHALLRSLPSIATSTSATPSSSRAVFAGNSLPQMSKASKDACVGGFCFFGDLLQWLGPSSQHAYAVFPEFRYNPKPPANEDSWTLAADEMASFAGQQRELLYLDGGNIRYAGTFFCHAGPEGVKIPDLGDDIDEGLKQAIARKTVNTTSKNPQRQQSKKKLYAPLLVGLYADGTATVRLLGLQRVGFNQKLFEVLRKAYKKRDRKASAGSSTSSTEAKLEAPPTPAPTPGRKGKKRTQDWLEVAALLGAEEAMDEEGEDDDGSLPPPNKKARRLI